MDFRVQSSQVAWNTEVLNPNSKWSILLTSWLWTGRASNPRNRTSNGLSKWKRDQQRRFWTLPANRPVPVIHHFLHHHHIPDSWEQLALWPLITHLTFVCFEATPDGAQGLLLMWAQELLLEKLRGLYGMLETEAELAVYKASAISIVLSLCPHLIDFKDSEHLL